MGGQASREGSDEDDDTASMSIPDLGMMGAMGVMAMIGASESRDAEAKKAAAEAEEKERKALLEAAGRRGHPDRASLDGWVEALLAYSGQHRVLNLSVLQRCSRVSQRWRQAVLAALPTLRVLEFRGCEECVTGPDVLTVLGRVAGPNLAAVDLARCKRLGAADVEKILTCVAEKCTRVLAIDVEGCSEEAQLCALAVCARALCNAASPRELFESITALPEGGDTRCPLEHLLTLLSQPGRPSLALDLQHGVSLPAVAHEHGSALVAAVLLSVSFPRTYDPDERLQFVQGHLRGRCAVHAAALRGDEALLQVLIRAGAALNVQDENGDTPLLLASRCRAGQLATMLLDNGADALAANKQGDTPLLASVAAGDAELALKLVARGANVAVSRGDGANMLALAIHSQNEACIKIALTQGPTGSKRLENQDTLDVFAFVQRLAQAFLDPAQIGAWIRGGATPGALINELVALLSSADVSAAVKDQLEEVRAFLCHHNNMLDDRSSWPVPQAEQLVAQLASQEPDATLARVATDALDAAMMPIIKRKNQPQARRQCRWTLKTGGSVGAVAVSPDGSRLAYVDHNVVGGAVVVRNVQTGLVQQGTPPQGYGPLSFSPDSKTIAAGCHNGIQLIDVVTYEVVSSDSDSCMGDVRGIHWSPCGSKIAVACHAFYDYCYSYVKIYHSENGTLLYNKGPWPQNDVVAEQLAYGKFRSIQNVSWAPDGSKIAAGLGFDDEDNANDRQCVVVFDTQTGKQLSQVKGHSKHNKECTCWQKEVVSKTPPKKTAPKKAPAKKAPAKEVTAIYEANPDCPVKGHTG